MSPKRVHSFRRTQDFEGAECYMRTRVLDGREPPPNIVVFPEKHRFRDISGFREASTFRKTQLFEEGRQLQRDTTVQRDQVLHERPCLRKGAYCFRESSVSREKYDFREIQALQRRNAFKRDIPSEKTSAFRRINVLLLREKTGCAIASISNPHLALWASYKIYSFF